MLVEMNLWPSPPPIAFTTITDSERLLVTWRILEHNRSSSTVHSCSKGYIRHSPLLWIAKHEGQQVDGNGNDSNSMRLSVTKQSWREGWWSAWQLTRIIWIAEFITQNCSLPSSVQWPLYSCFIPSYYRDFSWSGLEWQDISSPQQTPNNSS